MTDLVARLREMSSPDAERLSDEYRLTLFCYVSRQAADALEAAAAREAKLREALERISVLDHGVGTFKVSPKVVEAASIARAALSGDAK